EGVAGELLQRGAHRVGGGLEAGQGAVARGLEVAQGGVQLGRADAIEGGGRLPDDLDQGGLGRLDVLQHGGLLRVLAVRGEGGATSEVPKWRDGRWRYRPASTLRRLMVRRSARRILCSRPRARSEPPRPDACRLVSIAWMRTSISANSMGSQASR